MCLVVLLLTFVSSWIVQDNDSLVCAEDYWPDGFRVSYTHRDKTGNWVNEGDTANFLLYTEAPITLDDACMFMMAGKNGGTGEIIFSVNNEEITRRAFVGQSGTGPLYEQIDVPTCSGVHAIDIQVVGASGSVYVDRFVLCYAFMQPFSLTLMNDTIECGVLVEQTPSEGVQLPSMPNQGEWKFVGWTRKDFVVSDTLPAGSAPAYYGQNYYLMQNDTMWAVYQNNFYYSCHPFDEEGIDIPNVIDTQNSHFQVLMHFGHYDLIINNKKKMLRQNY